METVVASSSSLVLTGRYRRPYIHGPAGTAERLPDLFFASELLTDLVRRGLVPGAFAGVRPIDGDAAAFVEDKPFTAHVLGSGGRPLAVLSLSNHAFPELVRMQFEGAAVARSLLGPTLGKRILWPIASGFVAGRSFVIWPLRHPPSANRLRMGIEKRLLARPVMRWLKAVALRTRVELNAHETARMFAEPLARMAQLNDLDPAIRDFAGKALLALDSGDWRPVSILSHNDLWIGNLLAARVPLSGLLFPQGFTVIDWGGSSRMGYPLLDAIAFGVSIGRRSGSLRRDLLSYCEELSISPSHAAGYLCAALGALALKADCFQPQRFFELCANLMRGLQDAGMLEQA